MSESNFERGTKAEARIAKALKALYEHEENAGLVYELKEDNGRNPDLLLNDSSLGVDYQIECKSCTYPIRENKSARAGYAKLPANQVWKMVELHNSSEYSISVLMVEIRSAGGQGKTIMVVPWQRVIDKWNEKEPEMMSLGHWWILNNGVPLEIWWTALRNEPLFKNRIED